MECPSIILSSMNLFRNHETQFSRTKNDPDSLSDSLSAMDAFATRSVSFESSSAENKSSFARVPSTHKTRSLMMETESLLLIVFCICLSPQETQLMFQSSITLTPFGTAFLPCNPIELISTFYSVRSLLRCTMRCNQNRRCRTFDYDSSLFVCRLFEGQFSTGTVVHNQTLSSSRIGAILIDVKTDTFASYNRTCEQCGVNGNRYLECVNGVCQCPVNNYWNGQACVNQLYNGSSCNYSFASCRHDLNLTCSNITSTCLPPQPIGRWLSEGSGIVLV